MGWVVKADNPWKAPDNFSSDSKRLIQQLENALRIQGKEFSPEALDALQLGDVEGFLQAIDFKSLIVPQEKISSVLYDQAKNAGIKTFSDAGIDAKILFDAIDRRAVDYALNASSLLITNISDEIRTNVRQTIATALNGGLTLPQVASRIKTDLPLTARDAGAVDSFRQKQYEKFMRAGMPEGKARDKAEGRAQRYSEKLTRQRASRIARTEIVNASNQGRFMGWQEGVLNGYVDSSSKKEWIAEPDACPDCLPFDGEKVLWNESFSNGEDMPPLHPNCRCSSALVPPDYTDSPFNEIPNEAPEFDQQALSVDDLTGETAPLADASIYAETQAYLDDADALYDGWLKDPLPYGKPMPNSWTSEFRIRHSERWAKSQEIIYWKKKLGDEEGEALVMRMRGLRNRRTPQELNRRIAELPAKEAKKVEAIPEKRIDLPKLLDNASTDVERAEAFQKLFAGKDFNGFRVDPYSVYKTQGGLLSVKSKIRDVDGIWVGDVDRVYSRNDKGELIVEHELMSIEKPFRGRGFSTSFSQFSEELYKEMGVVEIRVSAGMTDGAYTWAKAGYEWSEKPANLMHTIRSKWKGIEQLDSESVGIPPELRPEIVEILSNLWKTMDTEDWRSLNYPTPSEIANLKGPDIKGMSFGRWLMEKGDWHGVKKIG